MSQTLTTRQKLTIAAQMVRVATDSVKLRTEMLQAEAEADRVKALSAARARRLATRRALAAKQAASLQRAITAACVPVFRGIVKEASGNIRSGHTKAVQLFDTARWKKKLIDAIFPVVARGYGQAAWAEVMLTGAEAGKKKKAFCPTGEGGGIDNSCSPKQEPQASLLSDEERSIAKANLAKLPQEPAEDYGYSKEHGNVIRLEHLGWSQYGGKIFGLPYTPDQLKKWGSIEFAPLDGSIKRGQTEVKVDGINAYLEGKGYSGRELPELVRTPDGSLYVHSGHTRLSVQKLAERTRAKVVIFDVDAKGKLLKKKRRDLTEGQEKASSASQWLQSSGQTPPPGIATEWPDWLVDAVEEELAKAFDEPYWAEIVDVTTRDDIEQVIQKGLNDGLSIDEISGNIRDTLGEEYYHNRAEAIAKTEAANSLNGGRKIGIEALQKELGDKVPIRAVWLSVLGDTTRDAHANLDGVPADDDGMWDLNGVQTPWPGWYGLPAGDRVNCQCSIVSEFLDDETANGLIEDYQQLVDDYENDTGEFADGKAYCPTGPGGGIDNSCPPKKTGPTGLSGIDTSTWPVADNSVAKYAKDKIEMMEALAWATIGGTGGVFSQADFDEFLQYTQELKDNPKNANLDPSLVKPFETYKLAVAQAYQTLGTEIASAFSVKANAPPPGQGVTGSPEVSSQKGWTKIGEKLGTQTGGTYTGPDGEKYYVKIPANPQVARNEVLATKLFAAAGGSVLESHLVEIDGKIGVAHKWEEDSKKADFNSYSDKLEATRDFAIHAWLANHDAVGAGSENPMDNIRWVNGKMTAVDVGGSLNFTGTGNPKGDNFAHQAGEWETLRNPAINPSAAHVFGGMTMSQLQNSAIKLENIDTQTIAELVHKYNGDDQKANTELTMKLINRRQDILDKAANMKAGTPKVTPPPAPHTPPIKPVGPAVPPPPTGYSPKNPGAYKKYGDIYAAAQTGSIAAVEAIKTNPNAKQSYAQGHHKYKMAVLAAMKQGGQVNPNHVTHTPTPAKPAVPKPKTPPAPKPIVIDPAQFPTKLQKSDFASSNATQVAQNLATVELAHEHAKKGDLTALQAMTSPSPKVQGHITSLAANLAQQLNPPPPPKTIKGTYDDVVKQVKHADHHAATVGYWAVLADLKGIPTGAPTPASVWNAHGPSDLWQKGANVFNALPSAQQTAVYNYTGGDYGPMNNGLRSGSPSAAAKAAAKAIKEKGIEIPAGMLLSRTYSPDGSLDKHLGKMQVGHVISEKGILSTSTDPYVWSGRSVQLHITVGPGVKGIPVATVSKSGSHEREIVLAPGHRFLVTKIEKSNSYGNSTTVHVIALPSE